MKNLEISKVDNVYYVVPSYRNNGKVLDFDEVSMFETFEGLVKFLRAMFEESNEPENR